MTHLDHAAAEDRARADLENEGASSRSSGRAPPRSTDPRASPWEPGRSALARARGFLADSALAPLAGKAAAFVVAVIALAAVGSGAATGLLPGSGATPAGAHLAGVLPQMASAPSAAADPRTPPGDHAPIAADPAPIAGDPALVTGDAGVPDASPDASAPGAALTPDGKVILNLAREDDLRRLPGIGPSRAQAILALRERLGRFKRPEDLLRVRGIGRRSLARLRPLIVVDPP